MHTKTVVRTALAAALALLVASTSAAEELRWKFKPGEALQYVIERGADGNLTLSGAEIKFTLSMIFDTTWKATAVAQDGTADVELVVDRIQINMNSPLFGRMAYDSNSPQQPEGPVWEQMKPVMTSMIGQAFQAKISPRGEVSDIELPKKLSEALAEQQIGENRRQGFGIGSSGFDEKGIKELLVRSVLPLPETSGEDVTWTQEFENEIPMMGTQFSETTFSVAGSETLEGQQLAKIASKTELFFEPLENPRADLEIMEQEAAATYYFDPAAGHMVKGEGTQKTRMEISGDQELSQQITETMKMRLGASPDEPAAAEKDANSAK